MYMDSEKFENWMERIMERFDRTEKLLERVLKKSNALDGEEVLDNQDLCLLLKVGIRTLQFRYHIPPDKTYPFCLCQVYTAVRHDQGLLCLKRPVKIIQVNTQVSFLVNQHVGTGVHYRIETLVRYDRTAVDGLVHVQGNLFHNNVFLLSLIHI